MALFDMLNQVAKTIGEKTGDAIETTKLSTKIFTEKAAAGEDLKKIGEYYYSLYAETGETVPELLELCQSAKAHYDAAQEAQWEIDRLKAETTAAPVYAADPAAAPAGIVCPGCGTANSAGTRFCQSCGTKLESEQPKGRFCPSCGAAVAPGVRFCPDCGQKMED